MSNKYNAKMVGGPLDGEDYEFRDLMNIYKYEEISSKKFADYRYNHLYRRLHREQVKNTTVELIFDAYDVDLLYIHYKKQKVEMGY